MKLNVLAELNDENLDIQPTGHPNTIRWNAGHLYITAEFLLNKADSDYEMKRPEWAAFFAPETMPSEWKADPICHPGHHFRIGRTKRPNSSTFFKKTLESSIRNLCQMNTVGSLVNLILYHEGIHSGTIKTLNNTIK